MNINRPRVYIAGPLNPHNGGGTIEYLRNCNRMIEATRTLIKCGYAPFCPAVDAAYFIGGMDDETPTAEEIKSYSASWVGACEAVLLMPGWEKSGGAKAEIEIAKRLNVPVFKSMNKLFVALGAGKNG
jgi:hypothetical protein